jgi:hypothetical protein
MRDGAAAQTAPAAAAAPTVNPVPVPKQPAQRPGSPRSSAQGAGAPKQP